MQMNKRQFLIGLTAAVSAPLLIRLPADIKRSKAWLEVRNTDDEPWYKLAYMILRDGSKINFAEAFPTFVNYKQFRVVEA